MRSRLARLGTFAAVIAAVAAISACGVTESLPRDMGDAKAATSLGGGGLKDPVVRADVDVRPDDLVRGFFQTAVGGDEAAVKRAKDFLSPQAQATWQPRQGLTVVSMKVVSSSYVSTSRTQIVVRLTPIGLIDSNGEAHPINAAPYQFVFDVQRSGQGWRLNNAPTGLMISEESVGEYYDTVPVYFWDLRRLSLIPDLRYLPRDLPIERRPAQLVDWLLAGPSDQLHGAVAEFKPGTLQRARAFVQPGVRQLVVNLSSAAVSDNQVEQQQLADQIRWSCQTYAASIDLMIEGQRKDIDGESNAYLQRDLAAASPQPELYSISAAGKVVPASAYSGAAEDLLNSPANNGVQSAAISRDHHLGAFVQRRGGSFMLTTVTASDSGKPVSHTIGNLAAPGRPAILPAGRDQVLITLAGRMFVADSTGRLTPLPINVDGPIKSFSVAPDGRRLALVAKGRVYVVGLAVDQSGVVALEPLQLAQGRLGAPAAVSWLNELQVVIAGERDGHANLATVSVDGVFVSDLQPKSQPLTDVVAFTQPPGLFARVLLVEVGSAYVYVYPASVVESQLIRPFYTG